MLTWEDCLGLSEIDLEVIDAIAEHEHIPEMVALEMANYMIHCDDGVPRIRRMIVDDIRASQAQGDDEHTRHLLRTLHHFVVFARHQAAEAGRSTETP